MHNKLALAHVINFKKQQGNVFFEVEKKPYFVSSIWA
jgi:hypothetical protein